MANTLVLDILSKAAYEAAVGIADIPEEAYFQVNAEHWKNLPPHAKEYWNKIARAVITASDGMDVGDLG